MPRDRITAREYHERTKHSPESVRRSNFRLDFANQPLPYKVYEGLESISLPDEDDLAPPDRAALEAIADAGPDPTVGAVEVGLNDLAACCQYSNGITKRITRGGRELLFRAAACTGALYHVDLYAVCGPTVRDSHATSLDAGVYHFDPRTRSFDVLREGDFRRVLVNATGAEEAVARAPVIFVATSTWWRNAWKYRARTFRHAFWDSGTVLANLLAVAHALDLPARVVLGFADASVANLLDVDVEDEAPLELVPVGAIDDEPDPVLDVSPIDAETKELSEYEEEYPLIREAYAASALRNGDDARGWRERRPSDEAGIGRRPPGDGERVPLEPVGPARAAKTPLSVAIERRGSCREYERDELNFRKISTIFDRAVGGFPADFRAPDGPPLQLNDCYLLVNGVAGVEPGAYHYHPESGELELLEPGAFRAEAGHLALDQRLAADAAVCAYFLTDLDAVLDRMGDRGYRAAQFEASLTAGKLYLATYAHRDLGGTGLTFYDDEVTEFFSPRAAGQTPTFLYTIGRPA